MAFFLFQPEKEVEVFASIMNQDQDIEPLSYIYNSKTDVWVVLDPKSGNWINYMVEGVPEIYRAQVLLLSAAYPD